VLKANLASVPRSEKVIGRADCPASVAVGDLVRITAAKIGTHYQVATADPTSAAGVPAVAVVLRKDSATECIVQFHGPIKGIYAGLSSGQEYYLGTDGKPAAPGDANFPVAGGSTRFQQIGVATSTDELFFHPLDAVLGSPGSGGRYYNQPLSGVIDGINTVFSTAQAFVAVGPRSQTLRMNGVAQESGVGCDYEVSESGGVGTGFDTVTMAFPLFGDDVLRMDFDPDI